MSAEEPDGVDLHALKCFLDDHGIGGSDLSDVRTLSGGSQNIIVAFTRAGRRWVLRRPPVAMRPEDAVIARREARVLTALAGTDVPHPRLAVACDDETPLGAPFQVSEYVDGFSLWGSIPESWSHDDAAVRRVGIEVVDAFASLARVDHRAIGLGDLGRSERWVERQPERWRKQLDRYSDVDGFTEERLPGIELVHTWLIEHLPPRDQPGLVHGDAHLGNVLIRTGGGVALVDWELCVVGDPLLDLAQLIVTWPTPDGPYCERAHLPGLPTVDELAARWEASSGRSAGDLGWFRVLASYRLAVLLEGTTARARAGLAPMDVGDTLHQRAGALVKHALGLADLDERAAHVGL